MMAREKLLSGTAPTKCLVKRFFLVFLGGGRYNVADSFHFCRHQVDPWFLPDCWNFSERRILWVSDHGQL